MSTKPTEIAAAAEAKTVPAVAPVPTKAEQAEATRHRRAKVAAFV